jgi:TonB family protein
MSNAIEIDDGTRSAAVVEGIDALISGNAPHNDLPRYCLEPDVAESNRALAWMNAICFVYLMIGVLGLRPADILINKKAALADEVVPTIIEPLVTPVKAVTEASPETPTEKAEESGGQVIAVTADSPEVMFSVPTVGNVLVPAGLAQAPPADPMRGAVPLSSLSTQVDALRVEQITVTGLGGSRPPPIYPRDSLLRKEEGVVVLRIEVSDSGRVASVTVKDSSGYSRLDQAALDQVRRRWFFEGGKGRRVYDCSIVFQLQ